MTPPLVMVTGARSGIGRAVALAFAAAGHPLLLLSRRMPPLPELSGNPAMLAEADVADAEAVEKAVRAAEAAHGPVGCLVNSAGMADARAFTAVAPADYRREVETNLLGVMNCTHAVLPGMVQRRAGTVITISSVSDRKTAPAAVAYTASKYGVRAFMESLREAHGKDGVRFVNLAPGYIRTEIHAGMGISFEEYCALLGNPDFMSAEQFAEVVLWCWRLPATLCVRDMAIAPTRTVF
jgi:NADP-dependent 3-hydroxy acid dehydrogenase YdfG